ncbi:MAG: tyrosine-type recombinase/integrase [Phycisphaerae bacterium]|nr:tyrosine-type recombinase/integrase [Phycisphaerae bacterium]
MSLQLLEKSVSNQPRVPSLRLHKPSGRAVVTLSGRDHYLGPYDADSSRLAYEKLIGEWLANGRRLIANEDSPGGVESKCESVSVAEVLLAFLEHCQRKYGARRQFPRIMSRIKTALSVIKNLFGMIPAAKFGPKALVQARDYWIGTGRSRKTVNDNTKVVKMCFKWAVREEMIPPVVWHGLSSVEGLRRGESVAAEPKKVRPVADSHVDVVLPYLLPPVRAMVELQRLTGMRPGEVCIMRACDLDMTGSLWKYTPAFHKTDYAEHDREIFLGPQSQAVLRPWLTNVLEAFLFRPADAVAEWLKRRGEKRQTPLVFGNRPGTNRKQKPRRVPREAYDVGSYRRAIDRACVRADRDARAKAGQPKCESCEGRGEITLESKRRRMCKTCNGVGRSGDVLIPRWHPHQLRHSYATRVRKEYGIEAARVMLGHQHVGVTEVYAERDTAVAAVVAQKIG